MGKLDQFLRDTLAELMDLDPDAISCDTSFDEQGLDSLAGLRFARKIQDELNIEFDPEWLYDHPTIYQLAAFLEEHSSTLIQPLATH